MQITLLKSKIHRAAVTGASLEYAGSLTVPADIAELVGLLPHEKILVGNLQNGERFETYAIYGPAGSGRVELNGATAHLGKIGDLLTIMSFARLTPEETKAHHPKIAVLDRRNRVIRCESCETPSSRREWEAEISRIAPGGSGLIVDREAIEKVRNGRTRKTSRNPRRSARSGTFGK